jgi:class 3 adenylate cyclase
MLSPLTQRSTASVLTIGVVLFLALFLVSGAYTVGRIKGQFYREKVRAGEATVNAIAGAARIALLGDDTLSLHSLVEGATRAEGLAYAIILDSGKRVKAKAEPAPQTAVLEKITGGLESIGRGEQDLPQTDVLASGARILRLSRPVTFMNKNVGYVVLGFSKDAIDNGIRAESWFLWLGFGILGLCALALLAGGLIYLSPREVPAASRAGNAGSHGRTVQCLPDSNQERNHVTVMFAGVKGFKKYADTREPGQVIRDINDYLAVATETITRFGGEVDKFIGDAVVGVFRSTVLSPDHIERAVRSAVALQDALRQAAGNGNPLYSLIGIGISSGVALAGQLAAGEFRDSLYIGESFKSAYLLHVIAGAGEIVIGREVYQVMESSLSVEPLPPREMMEKTESWENFRLLRVRDERTAVV